jgi:hypothetical protein
VSVPERFQSRETLVAVILGKKLEASELVSLAEILKVSVPSVSPAAAKRRWSTNSFTFASFTVRGVKAVSVTVASTVNW